MSSVPGVKYEMSKYELVLSTVYRWNNRISVGGDASPFRTCLIISAFQLINAVTFCFVLEITVGIQLQPSKLALTLFSVLLFGLNLAYASRRYEKWEVDGSQATWSAADVLLGAYLLISIVTFIVAGLCLPGSGN